MAVWFLMTCELKGCSAKQMIPRDQRFAPMPEGWQALSLPRLSADVGERSVHLCPKHALVLKPAPEESRA